jgi:hypothetical protein
MINDDVERRKGDDGQGGRGDKRNRIELLYLDLALGESTQVIRAVVLEASCPERACGVHACPIIS